MENRSRLYVNIIKGVAIFLMLWTHCIQYCAMDSFKCYSNTVFKTVYTFHMPLFMLVSGYLYFFSFQKRNLKALLIHRTQSMLQPIALGTVLHNLLLQLAFFFLGGKMLIVSGYLFSGMTEIFWFLWCVLASSLAVGIAFKVTQNGVIQIVLMILGAFFVRLFPSMEFQSFMYLFFLTGFLWAKYKPRLMNIVGKLKYAALVIFPLMLPFYTEDHYIYITPMYSEFLGVVGSLKFNLFRYLIGLAGSAFVMVVIDILLQLVASKDRIPKILAAVGKIGENSLQIYCLSASLLSGYLPIVYEKLMQPFGYNVIAENWVLYNLVFTPLLAAAYTAGLYAVVLLMKKAKIHSLIFGR